MKDRQRSNSTYTSTARSVGFHVLMCR